MTNQLHPPPTVPRPRLPPHASRPTRHRSRSALCSACGRSPVTAEVAANYLADVRETDPLYAREGLVHPGLILRTCNWALMHNVILGPWIHVGSEIQHLALARVGDEVSVRARVSANYERKGHRFVELDAIVLANAGTPVAHIVHTAIYRPRQVAA